MKGVDLLVAPARERGLKFTLTYDDEHIRCRSREGAWIEITDYLFPTIKSPVAPARERGLKFNKPIVEAPKAPSLPRGSVD